jgi:hypothetical protein
MLVASSEKARDSVLFAETAKGRREETQHSVLQDRKSLSLVADWRSRQKRSGIPACGRQASSLCSSG